jgi:hypothetical protein
VFARRLLGRDRLEIVEQSARQSQTLLMAQQERLSVVEAELRAVSARATGASEAVDRLHRTLVDADPESMRTIVDLLRVEVGELVITINRLLGERASAEPDTATTSA